MSKPAQRGVGLAPAFAGLLMGATALRAAPPTVAPPTIDDQYHAVLQAMKHPQATGILVTEIGPDSPAGGAGLLAGDILFHFANTPVHDLQTLRQLVADNFAAHAAGEGNEKVLLGVHRGDQDVLLRIPREPLGIRAIEVDAGVPVPFNPLPSPRGSITMAWEDLIKNQITTAAGDTSYFRVNDLPPPPTTAPDTTPDSTWLGWQHRAMNVGDDALLGQLDTYHVNPDAALTDARIASSESVRFRLRTGDYASSPAFLLDSFDVTLNNGDGSVTTMTSERAGTLLRTQTTITAPTRTVGPIARQVDCPTNAIIPAALPLLAAALPHQSGAGLAVSMLSIRDGLSRPGYLLIAQGQHPRLNEKDAPLAWRVDLLHCGVVVESFWFTDQRRLLATETPSGTTIIARRVGSQDEAISPVTPASAAPPTTQPAATQRP